MLTVTPRVASSKSLVYDLARICASGSPNFVMVDYVREMTAKKSCEHGEYGSFKHLLLIKLFQKHRMYRDQLM